MKYVNSPAALKSLMSKNSVQAAKSSKLADMSRGVQGKDIHARFFSMGYKVQAIIGRSFSSFGWFTCHVLHLATGQKFFKQIRNPPGIGWEVRDCPRVLALKCRNRYAVKVAANPRERKPPLQMRKRLWLKLREHKEAA